MNATPPAQLMYFALTEQILPACQESRMV